MHKLSTFSLIGVILGSGVMIGSSKSYAQSRTPPAGSALAQTPPADRRAKQFKALPSDQKNMYLKQTEQAKPK